MTSVAFPSAFEFARAIDAAAEGGATEKWVPPKLVPVSVPTPVSGFDAMVAAFEKAATAQDQLAFCNGLPLVFNEATQRYTLAPTAETVYNFIIEAANRPPTKLDLGASKLFAARTAAAEALAQ
jgi:hypothetical protein